MTKEFIYPLILAPVFKDYIWGGTRLKTEFGKRCSTEKLAESWELAAHDDGTNTIANGPCQGMYLSEYIRRYPESLGKCCTSNDKPMLPIIVKLIDAADNLSLQVHPDDCYAEMHEHSNGKSEMWYILDSLPGSELICGLSKDCTREELRAYAKNKTLLNLTNTIETHAGDTFFIPPGTLHAIGKGNLIVEVQQNSNITYRVYDYDRVGKNGLPRELHIEKAIDVISTKKYVHNQNLEKVYSKQGGQEKLLCNCPFFTVYKIECNKKMDFYCGEDVFMHILAVEGSALFDSSMCDIAITIGDSLMLPAGIGKFSITGNIKCIISMPK